MEEKESKVADGQHVLKEKVSEYKKTHPEALPEFDYAFMLKSLKKVSESSEVRVARNAFNENREWIPGTETHGIGKVFLSEDHCVVFTVRGDGKSMTVEQLIDELESINKKLPLKNVPVMLEISEGKRIKITDAYAHTLVQSAWAGMPLDFVLCYEQKKEARKVVLPEE